MTVAVEQEIGYQIRNAIAAALKTIPGMQASPYLLSDPTMPSAAVMRGPVLYDQAMSGGTHTWTFIVRLYVATLSDIVAQMLLDTYLSPTGPQSVKAAIEADPTLGGIIDDLHVQSATGENEIPREQGGPVLGSEFTVEVWL